VGRRPDGLHELRQDRRGHLMAEVAQKAGQAEGKDIPIEPPAPTTRVISCGFHQAILPLHHLRSVALKRKGNGFSAA
jgi:hypothetical protein